MALFFRRLSLIAAVGATLLLVNACAVGQKPLGNPEQPYPLPRPPQVGDFVHLPTGTPVNEAELLAAISDVRIVYVGETHDNPASHRFELMILQAMAERWPGQVSLGMEMFTRRQQPVLDRWVAGELSEKAFLKEVGWYSAWKMDFALYRELLLFARDRHIPVIGLNAEKDLVRTVSRTPLEALSAEDRARVPEMDLTDPYQSALVKSIYAGHVASDNQLAGFQRVQTLWDEVMAETVADHLLTCLDGSQRMVVVAGGNHIRHGTGIPRRVFRRLPTSYVLTGIHEIAIPASKQDRLMNVELPKFPMPPYDYIAYVAYEELPGEKVKLGVRFEEENHRVVVREVVPGSSADAAGVQGGDLLLTIDGEAISDSFDLIYSLEQKTKGDKGILEVERAGEPLRLEIVFQPLPKVEMHKP
jgi:uncharacterized iron-regulated protein